MMYLYKSTQRTFCKFLKDERGALSVEFSILLTAISLVVVMFVAASIHLATISDVQQAAHDLTRQSLRYIDTGMAADEVCASLQRDVLRDVADNLTFVELERIKSLSCTLEENGTAGQVKLAYEIEGSFIERAAQMFGYTIERLERSARIIL